MSNLKGLKSRSTSSQVPHHEQQYDFTCGPASLMMIFKHFDKKFEFTKAMETDIWRESSLAPLPPTSRYGLAYSALKRGFGVSILANLKGIEYVNKTPAHLTGPRREGIFQQFMEVMKEQFEERKERAFELGLREKIVKKLSANDVAGIVEKKGLSVLLTSARFFDDQDWAHWVVVTGHDNHDNFYINDPASKANKGRRVFSRKKFDEVNGYYGDQVLISVFK